MKLLKIEWLKLKSYSTFWILIGMFITLFLFWNYGITQSFISMGSGTGGLLSNSYAFPAIWSNMGYVYSWFVIFLCVFIIISISNEFAYRTNRQHIMDGMERLDFLHAKAILILSISIMSTLFFILSALLFGYMNGGGNPFDRLEKIAYVFIYTLNYLSFAALITFFIKRSGLSIMLLLAFFLVEMILSGLINWKFDTYAGNLLPLQCSDELLPLDALRTIGSITGNTKPEAPELMLAACGIIYVAGYYLIVRHKMQTSDL